VPDAELAPSGRVERRARVVFEIIPAVEREDQAAPELEHRRRSAGELGADDAFGVEAERPVERQRALEVGDAEREHVNAGLHAHAGT